MTEFKDDVKRCLMKCGVEDKAWEVAELSRCRLGTYVLSGLRQVIIHVCKTIYAGVTCRCIDLQRFWKNRVCPLEHL